MNSAKIMRQGIKNTFYVVFAQFISYGLSFITAFILPGILGVVPFAYYQVYIFYSGYVGFLHFGFVDGIYLRYGSYDYNDIPRELFRGYVTFFFIFEMIVAAISLSISFTSPDKNKQFAFFFVALDIFVINLSTLFNYINQITGRIKLYTFVVVVEKVQIIAAILIMIVLKKADFKYVIVFDFGAKLVVMLINLFNCRDIVIGKRISLFKVLPECLENFNAGIKLLIANFMAMLVMGLGKFILERFGSLVDFGMYSFAVSSTNIAMMFITSVSMILYPMLCRFDKNNLPKIFNMLNQFITAIIFIMLLMYYPLLFIIHHFLTKYVSTISFLYLLFPIVIMSSKIELLINTFYKSLREERAMLTANLSSVVLFLVLAIPTFAVFHSIYDIIWATLITFTWRCYASEVFLKRKMKISCFGNIADEIVMAAGFIISTGVIKGSLGFISYLILILLYLAKSQRQIIKYIRMARHSLMGADT